MKFNCADFADSGFAHGCIKIAGRQAPELLDLSVFYSCFFRSGCVCEKVFTLVICVDFCGRYNRSASQLRTPPGGSHCIQESEFAWFSFHLCFYTRDLWYNTIQLMVMCTGAVSTLRLAYPDLADPEIIDLSEQHFQSPILHAGDTPNLPISFCGEHIHSQLTFVIKITKINT